MDQPVRFGINFMPTAPAAEVVRCAWLVEHLGYELLGISDSQSICRDVYMTLALCAVNTERIRFGPRVITPVTRHPAVAASAAATLKELAPGRTLVAIGSGDSAAYNLGLRPASLAELREYTGTIRALLATGRAEYHGKTTTLTWKRARLPPTAFCASRTSILTPAGWTWRVPSIAASSRVLARRSACSPIGFMGTARAASGAGEPTLFAGQAVLALENARLYEETLVDLFNQAFAAFRTGDNERAARLINFPEVQEVRFGYAQNTVAGRGMGRALSRLVIKTLQSSPALVERGLRHVEELQLFSTGIAEDRISDLAANAIKQFLISYTQSQCRLWDIPTLDSVPLEHIWSPDRRDWIDDYVSLPVDPDTNPRRPGSICCGSMACSRPTPRGARRFSPACETLSTRKPGRPGQAAGRSPAMGRRRLGVRRVSRGRP